MSIANDVVAKRRAFQQYLIENEGRRMPIQGSGSDYTGIDYDTFWDQTLDGNPLKFYQKKHEIKMFATIINKTYYSEGEVNADDLYQRIKLKNQQMQNIELEKLKNVASQITGFRTEPDGTIVTERINTDTGQLEEISRTTPPRLPADFSGIRVFTSSYMWNEAEIKIPDFGNLDLPLGLPPEIINECRYIEIRPLHDTVDFIQLIVFSTIYGDLDPETVIMETIFPRSRCQISMRNKRRQ